MNASTTSCADATLQATIDNAYRVFARHEVPSSPLDVCTFCCITEEEEQALRTTPLRELTAHQLRRYHDTAKSAIQSTSEVGYFLPRMLELLSQGEEINHSTELVLERLGACPINGWNESEQQALDDFASAFFDVVLERGPLSAGVHFWLDDALSLLLMFDIGGRSIEPLMARWLLCDHPNAAVQYVEATYWHFWQGEEYSNAFAENRPGFRERLRAWLLDPACRRVFAQRLLEPDFQRLAATHEMGRIVPFPLMVDAVFDHLVR